TVQPTALVEEALKILGDHRIDQVIVIDSDLHPIGLLDIQDILNLKI
ncbi:MAG: CBS domain-containing protein, partial [Bdellovibrionales bacterium]|nr:CBS domain-containing protein [Bdellovibrionales bacterium]